MIFFFTLPKCNYCNKRIYFWQDATNYLLSFDMATGKEETIPMHWECGFSKKHKECFGFVPKGQGLRNLYRAMENSKQPEKEILSAFSDLMQEKTWYDAICTGCSKKLEVKDTKYRELGSNDDYCTGCWRKKKQNEV